YSDSSIMLPVLLPSTASSVIPPPPHERSIIGGRKRSNDSVDQYPLANRNSSWDVSDDDSASTPRWTMLDDERRSQHNEREKRRRDRINDRFLLLRDAIPALKHEKPSRSLILKRAAEYIAIINHRVTQQSKIIEHLQRKNEPL
ncbi:hypothetical protein PENTCL1PPCAC_4184, partial [Pristionchus entomophagus]